MLHESFNTTDDVSSDSLCRNCATVKKDEAKSRANQLKTITDYESGEIICSNCGMVIADNILATGPESRNVGWSEAEANGHRQHTGSPISLARHDKGLYTVIGEKDSDSHGRQIDPLVRSTMHKIRMHDVRTQLDPHDRNLLKAFIELDKLRGKLSLPDTVVEKTAIIYRKVERRGIIRGRTIHSILAASLYIACREMGITKTLKEIAATSNIRLKTLSKDYRVLLTELDLKVPNNDLTYCVLKVGNSIQISERTKRRAIELVDIISKKDRSTYTSGKDPMGLAATILFVASANNGENITQREIATAAGKTSVTIRSRLKELGKNLQNM